MQFPPYDLYKRYNEPHRSYHNLRHIFWMLTEFELVKKSCQSPEDVELAIWFHDAVYDPKAKDNEDRSVDLARSMLGDRMNDNIERMILLTKHHAEPSEFDGKAIVDCDLAILGAERTLFNEYEDGIRKEYDYVPLEQYVVGRSMVMKGFLDRESIYKTEVFQQRYEANARMNLLALLAKLGGRDGTS